MVTLCLLSPVDIGVLGHKPQLSQDKVVLCESDSDKQHTLSVLLSVAVGETVLNVCDKVIAEQNLSLTDSVTLT